MSGIRVRFLSCRAALVRKAAQDSRQKLIAHTAFSYDFFVLLMHSPVANIITLAFPNVSLHPARSTSFRNFSDEFSHSQVDCSKMAASPTLSALGGVASVPCANIKDSGPVAINCEEIATKTCSRCFLVKVSVTSTIKSFALLTSILVLQSRLPEGSLGSASAGLRSRISKPRLAAWMGPRGTPTRFYHQRRRINGRFLKRFEVSLGSLPSIRCTKPEGERR